ncbi:GNAT family N-acetyltransferase [Oceanobacillus bengalensis]|uniref:N-acetyltransferase n=1 Tax=Oceanobacillus bengalensis TaxID=1435466 RepID=A0A494YRJ4_9BACI|nr:N-acetyltransferase [Oceanobacillus bengalensis]RKQ12082.1 N-acetyltransferase [Oceanobacillus bengalensis]
MQAGDKKFTIVKADKLEIDVSMQMSEIFAEGFSQWLEYFSKDKNKIAKAFAHMFVLEQFYVAVVNDKVAGMAACTDGKTLSIRLNKKELKKHLGFIRGSIAGIVLKKEWEAPIENFPPDTGSIEFVGTAIEYRGQGAASQIISHILENALYNDYVIEEVADTNIPAMKLYKKLGFEEYKRKSFPEKMAKINGINHLLSLKYVK